jgi:hypothetical protein
MVKVNKWAREHPLEWNKIQREASRKRRSLLRAEIIALLGGKCSNSNCAVIGGMKDPRALQIDHAERGLHGHVYERKSKGCEMYMKEVLTLIKSGSKEFQLLCANCNWIKRYEENEIRPRI